MARLISASTWEEVREESEGNHYMEKVRDEMIKMSQDESERYLYLREQMAIRDKASQLRSAENINIRLPPPSKFYIFSRLVGCVFVKFVHIFIFRHLPTKTLFTSI